MHSGVKAAPPRAATSRKWLQIDAQGKLAYVNVDKHTLVLRLNIPYRDLRSLESTVRQSVQHGTSFLTSAEAFTSPGGLPCRLPMHTRPASSFARKPLLSTWKLSR